MINTVGNRQQAKSLFYIPVATISIVFNTALHDLNIYTHKLQEYKYIYINYYIY